MILCKPFTITGVANNTVEASAKLINTVEEPKYIIGVRINPATTEDDFIQVHVRSRDLTDGGMYRANINDYTHMIEVETQLRGSEEVVVKGRSGATGRDVIGEIVYEIKEAGT